VAETAGAGLENPPSSIPHELPPSPMMLFPIGIEHPLDVPVQNALMTTSG